MSRWTDLPVDEWLRAELGEAFGAEREAWALERVARVSERLHRARPGRPELTTEILWIRDITAFTAPGRFIYLSRRLLERCATDEPVAFILAHEMAHHDLRHLELFEGWKARLPRVGGSKVIAAAFRVLERQFYGPEEESAADAEALRLCLAAGYDGEQCLKLFDVLEANALDRGDLDGVFGMDVDLEPASEGIEDWLQRARLWTWQRFRGYLPIRERRALLQEQLRRHREAQTATTSSAPTATASTATAPAPGTAPAPASAERIRVTAVALCVHEGKVLLQHGHDRVANTRFLRPIGGGVNFGERAADAVAREWREEVGRSLRDITLLGVLENRFAYEGRDGHEVVFVFSARLAQPHAHEEAVIELENADGGTHTAEWVPLERLRRGEPAVVPQGILGFLARVG